MAEAKNHQLQVGKASWSRAPFIEAADRFMQHREVNVKPQTAATERHQLKALKSFFDCKPLGAITADDIRAYQAHRHVKGRSGRTINHEVGLLRRVMKRGKVWHRVAGDFKFLKFKKSAGQALTQAQKANLLKVAASRPDWQIARLAAILALNTTMRSCEIKGLRWRDVNWLDRILSVCSSKTDAGVREIPINGSAWNILRELHVRAQLLGTSGEDSPVFAVAPGRPVKSWRSAWKSLTAAAGIPGFRFHDCRHHAVTELAESQTSDLTIMEISGHIDRAMLKAYSHVRLATKRNALDVLDARPTPRQPTQEERAPENKN